MTHALIKRSAKDYYCTKCDQQWVTPSKAHCPGLHVVGADEWGTLMTKTQLGRFGYKNDAPHLPKPKACYRRSYDGSSPEYVMLYERNECVPKKEIKKGRRKTGYLSEIAVPPIVASMIERFQKILKTEDELKHSADHSLIGLRYEAAADLCNIVTYAQLMTDQELQSAGFITLQVPPIKLPKGTVFNTRTGGVMGFAFNILTSYEMHLNPEAKQTVSGRSERPGFVPQVTRQQTLF